MAITVITDTSFKEEVESAETALVYFGADWCLRTVSQLTEL